MLNKQYFKDYRITHRTQINSYNTNNMGRIKRLMKMVM